MHPFYCSQMMSPASPTTAALARKETTPESSPIQSSPIKSPPIDVEAETVEMQSEDYDAGVGSSSSGSSGNSSDGSSSSISTSQAKGNKKGGFDLSGGWKSMSLSPILPPLFSCTLCMQVCMVDRIRARAHEPPCLCVSEFYLCLCTYVSICLCLCMLRVVVFTRV